MVLSRGWWSGLALLVGVGSSVGGVACGTTSNDPKTPGTGEAFGGVMCSAVRPQTEPDLMGWDSGSRAKLNRLRRSGVVAVRYVVQGCNVELEVLENCIATGAYTYEAYAASDTKLARNSTEVFAEFPVGASHLGGHVKNGRVLRTDYLMVGTDALPPSANIIESDLKGRDCDRATHVVRTVYLGGFAMAAGNESDIAGGGSVFGVGAGAGNRSSSERVASEGILTACEQAQRDNQQNPQCSVPLRIALMPLPGRVASPATPTAPDPPANHPGPPSAGSTAGAASGRGATVVDAEGHLTWQRGMGGPFTQREADDYCDDLTLAFAPEPEGRVGASSLLAQPAPRTSHGWRLPDKNELKRISGSRGVGAAFSHVPGQKFWSSTYGSEASSLLGPRLLHSPSQASPSLLGQAAVTHYYALELASGNGGATQLNEKHYVRCVR